IFSMIFYKKKEETIKPREPFWAFFCVFSLRSIFKAIFGFYQFAFLPYLSYFIPRPLVLITNPSIHSLTLSLSLSLSLTLSLSFALSRTLFSLTHFTAYIDGPGPQGGEGECVGVWVIVCDECMCVGVCVRGYSWQWRV